MAVVLSRKPDVTQFRKPERASKLLKKIHCPAEPNLRSRLSHFLFISPTTETPPVVSNNARQLCKGSCIIWVHLQASICTEWEQKSMVLSPGTNIGAKVTTGGNQRKIFQESSSIIEALKRDDKRNPKTVHRCILQSVGDMKNNSKKPGDLQCHVCQWKYSTYDDYFKHLIEQHCSRQKTMQMSMKREFSSDAPGSCQKKNKTSSSRSEKRTRSQDEISSDGQAVPLNLTFKKSSTLPLKEGSRDPILTSSVVESKKILPNDINREAVRDLIDSLLKTVVSRPETINDSVYCPHWASRYLPALNIADNVEDEMSLSQLKTKITHLLVLVFGEERLTTELGYPAKDVFEILKTASFIYGKLDTVHTEREACRKECKSADEYITSSSSSSYFSRQLKYRLLKRKLNTTKKNLLKFIDILSDIYF